MRLEKDHQIHVGAVIRLLRAQKPTTPRFNLPYTTVQACSLLEACYQVEVEKRMKSFEYDAPLRQIISRVAHYLTNPRCPFGLLLCGTCGNGKTTMLYAIRSLIFFTNDQGLWDTPHHTVSAPLYDAREIAQIAKDYRPFRQLKSLPLLFLDDLGKEATEQMHYGNIYSPVIELLEHRYAEQLPTFITSNLTPAQLSQKYKERMADRFKEMLEVIVFPSSSHRTNSTQNYEPVNDPVNESGYESL